MRLKRYIKEATYSQDKLFRDIAVKAYDKVKKILDKKFKAYEKTGKVDLEAHKNTQGWVIYGREFGYPDLVIMLTHKGRYAGAGFSSNAGKSRGETLKAISMPTLIEPNDFRYANTRFNKRDFVHEFIHYLDFKRGDKYQNTAKLLKTKGEKAYYNTPGEFNAYFQEGAEEVEIILRSIAQSSKPEFTNEILESMESFKDWMVQRVNNFSKDWIRNLEGKWKQKFQKRLYMLYKAMRKKYKIGEK